MGPPKQTDIEGHPHEGGESGFEHVRPGRAYHTIMSGLVIRWRFHFGRDCEISAGREGVSLSGEWWPVLDADQSYEFARVWGEARNIAALIASGRAATVKAQFEPAEFP